MERSTPLWRAAGLALLAASVALLAPSGPLHAEEDAARQPGDPGADVAAYLDDQAVTRREVEEQMRPALRAELIRVRERLARDGQWEGPRRESYVALYLPVFRQALRELVRERLLLREAEARQLKPDEAQLEAAVRGEVEKLGVRDTALAERLTAETRARVRQRMLVELVRAGFAAVVSPATPAEVEAHYQAHRAEYPFPLDDNLRAVLAAELHAAAVRRAEDAWFRQALAGHRVLGEDRQPVEPEFFFPGQAGAAEKRAVPRP